MRLRWPVSWDEAGEKIRVLLPPELKRVGRAWRKVWGHQRCQETGILLGWQLQEEQERALCKAEEPAPASALYLITVVVLAGCH